MHLNTLGGVLYRAGRYAEVVQRLEEAIQAHGKGGLGWDWLFLAMAHHRLGHTTEARQWLDKAIAWLPQVEAGTIKDPYVSLPVTWNFRLEIQMFIREAEALIKSAPEPKP